jgi:hypothetical protein
MKKFTALIVLIFWTSLCHADICKQRLVIPASPVFPGTLNAVHTLRNEKFCAIDLAYSLNTEGRAENIVSRPERDICTGFKVSAIRALRSSQFEPGDYVQLCYIRVNFRFEDKEMKTDFAEVPDYVIGSPASTQSNPTGYQ